MLLLRAKFLLRLKI